MVLRKGMLEGGLNRTFLMYTCINELNTFIFFTLGKIRKLFNLSKEDDVRQYVIRRPMETKEGKPAPKKPKTKAPKIQRLVTPQRLQRKRHELSMKKARASKGRHEAAEYAKMLAKRAKDAKEKRHELHLKRRRISSIRESKSH